MKNLGLLLLAAVGLYVITRPKQPQYDQTQVNAILQQMRADPAWLDSLTAKAAANGVSLEDQMLTDAIWLLNNPNS